MAFDTLAHPLKYLIGAPKITIIGNNLEVLVVPYNWDTKPAKGYSVGYCNLLDEKNQVLFDTEEGFLKNLRDQFKRRKKSRFRYVELDNLDSYSLAANLRAMDLAEEYKLWVLVKNPGLGCTDDDTDKLIQHKRCVGIIVERGAGTPTSMDDMRLINGKFDLPVWFVFHGTENRTYAQNIATRAKKFRNMYVSISPYGEYNTSEYVYPNVRYTTQSSFNSRKY